MLAGIRTVELRKVYTSPPPVAAGGGGFSFRAPGGKSKQPKPQITALDGISLEIRPGEIFCLLAPRGAHIHTTRYTHPARAPQAPPRAHMREHRVGHSERGDA